MTNESALVIDRLQREIAAKDAEIARLVDPALPVERRLQGARALVLYFLTDADRDEFVEIFKEAKPNCSTVKVR